MIAARFWGLPRISRTEVRRAAETTDTSLRPLTRSERRRTIEHQQRIVPDQYNIRTAVELEGNSQLNGVGQDTNGKTFVAIAIDAEKSAARQFGIIAVTRDGRQMESGPAVATDLASAGATVGIARFEFEVPLADVAHFRVGTRPVRTMEWKDVALYRELPPSRPIGTNTCVARWPQGSMELVALSSSGNTDGDFFTPKLGEKK